MIGCVVVVVIVVVEIAIAIVNGILDMITIWLQWLKMHVYLILAVIMTAAAAAAQQMDIWQNMRSE